MLPREIKNFIDEFAKLPSIGPRQATRLAFRIVGYGRGKITSLARAIEELGKMKFCTQCFFIHSQEGQLCPICADPQRKKEIIMIVEKETDLISLERTKRYEGVYFILGELTRSGVLEEYQKVRLNALKRTIQGLPEQRAQEIIIGLNPNIYGDLTTALLKKELTPLAQHISRIGRGIPTGGEIEFADEDTLGHSLEGRK